MRNPTLVELNDQSAAGEVRRLALLSAERISFNEEDAGRLAIVATELSTNLLKHAGGGLFLFGLNDSRSDVIEILALDNGPGIPNIGEALRDGHSTTGSPGSGLGAVKRLSNFFQVYSLPEHGTAVLSRVARDGSGATSTMAALSLPLRGEAVNGDAWSSAVVDGRTVLMIADGLGHGHPANQASIAARDVFSGATGSPAEILKTIHESIRHTRGAAVAIAELDPSNRTMRFAGLGNISASMIEPDARRSAVSMHGIVGHESRDIREFQYPWSRETCLIMHSDGLTTRWDLDRYPSLLGKDPALIAGVLWKDHRRLNDDSTVLVARTP